jgi:GPH family glycoside/pentoside/hexuronide:cation symporter
MSNDARRSPEAASAASASPPADADAPRDRLSAGTIAQYAVGSIGTGGFGTLPGLVLPTT